MQDDPIVMESPGAAVDKHDAVDKPSAATDKPTNTVDKTTDEQDPETEWTRPMHFAASANVPYGVAASELQVLLNTDRSVGVCHSDSVLANNRLARLRPPPPTTNFLRRP